ncbi:MAG: DUF2075 domain-containing protein [Opitutales bacterium]|nr:DUF2075 domain-containing protein [Opitutales bacterium]
MRRQNSYYSSGIKEFLSQSSDEIFGVISSNSEHFQTQLNQANSWLSEIEILKNQLAKYSEGRIIFEYIIPRMGKRIDAVFLHKNIVFLLEFKCGDSEYKTSAIDQVYDYALDLKNFQKQSARKLLVPIVVSTKAPDLSFENTEEDRILAPIKCNENNIADAIDFVSSIYSEENFNYIDWENSEYFPTPTIVEAAQALYSGHNVEDITRNDAGAENLSITSTRLGEIIEFSKANRKKSICFVTGVPGAGKTLVGLNLAMNRSNAVEGERAVFLSGNFPLVAVLQEALARDYVANKKMRGITVKKADALRKTSAFIQIIHKYRDSFVNNDVLPAERVVIFDESQRAWTKAMIKKFMSQKKGIENFDYSEPEFLISTMNRHRDWAVIVCLVGGGQEINTGEAGLPEWFDSLRRSFKDWDIYVSPQLNDTEYCRDRALPDLCEGLNICADSRLHLSSSVRSFRTPKLAALIKATLDVDINNAKSIYAEIKDKYPIFLTRDLAEAKKWVLSHCHGTTRCGLLASSGALRLKPAGIFVKNEISVENYFLNSKDDVRSSYFLEDVVTEFDIQGLEVDYSLVAWDADFRYNGIEWTYNKFVGSKWQNIISADARLYLKNAYRVLLTRARQGMAIFVPLGSDEDPSRKRDYYDETFKYLAEIFQP